MKTNNRHSKGQSKSIPDNSAPNPLHRTKTLKRVIFQKPQFISIATLTILCFTILLNEVFHVPDLLRGIPPQPTDWIHFATEIVAILLVTVSFILILSLIRSKYKRAKEVLKESQEQFRTIFETANDVIVYVNTHGKILEVNEKVQDIFGYTRDEVKGKNFAKLGVFRLKDAPKILKLFKDAVLKGRVMDTTGKGLNTMELVLKRKDGSNVFVESSTTAVKKNEKLQGFVNVLRDITERKRAEEALRESEERYRNLFENSPIGIYRTTPDGRILMANPVLIRMLGFSSFDELASRNLEEEGFEAAYPRSQFKERIEREGEVRGLEAAWVRRDKSAIFVRENAKAIRGEDGDVLYYEGTVEDITERKKAEDALKKERHRLFSVLDVLPAYVYVQAADYSVPFVNRKFRELFGDPDDRPCYEVFHGRSEPCEDCFTLRVLKTRAPQSYEWTSKDGRTYMIFEDLFPTTDGQEMVVEVGIDITERKRAEEALRENEERFRIASQIASDVVYERDGQTGIATFYGDIDSHLGYESGGYPRTMEGWRKHVHPEDLAWINNKSIDQLESGVPYTIEYRMRKKDGTYMTWSDRIMIIRDEKTGKPLKFIGAATDITERKKAEEVLGISEEKFRLLLMNLNDAVYVHEVSIAGGEKFIEVNDRACKMLGYTKEEFLSLSVPDIDIPEHTKEVVPLILDNLFKTKQAVFETKHRAKDGRMIPVEVSIRLFELQGKPTVLSVVRDITERKLAEEALKEETQRRRILMNSSRDGIVIINQEHEVVEVNPRFAKMLGYTPEELLGLHTWDYEAIMNEAEIRANFADIAKTQAIFETCHRRKDGTIFDVEVSAGGAVVGDTNMVFAVCRDITERKRGEEALRESEAKWRLLLENSPDFIYMADSGGKVLFINRTLLEHSKDEVIGKSVYDFLVPEYHDAMRERYKSIFQKGCADPLETGMVRRDGTRVFFETRYVAIKHGGKVASIMAISTDITERKRAEEAIRESEEKYRSVIENIGIGVSLISPNMEILTLNHQMKKWFPDIEISKKPICYKAFNNPPREKVCSYCPTFKTLQDGLVHESITETPSGNKIINYRIVSSPIKDKSGKIIAAIEMVEDITERKQAERALEESERKYRTLVETAQEGIGIVDPDENIVFTNQAFADLLGYNKDELLGLNLRQISDKEEFAKFRKGTQKRHQGESSRYETKLCTKTGEPKYFSISATPLLDDRGDLTGTLGLLTDITERKRAEEVLRENEQRLSTFMNSATDGILIFDSEFNLVEANKSALRMLGLNKTDVIGKNILDISPDVREKGRYGRYLKVMKSGEPFSVDNIVLHPKFGEKHLTIKSFKVGEGLGIIGTDITEQKKMEAQLIQAERLSAVGTLAYGIAHEFNNILAGILGNAEFGMGSDDPKEVEECFRVIMEGCDRAKGITNSLLAFSRQRETKKQRADVTEAVETVVGLVERELEKQNIKVVRKFSPIPEITCDLGELSSVVLNMIINARDAMKPNGGALTIEVGEKKDNIEMNFIDTGCGIPDSVKSRIFEPFVTTKGALGQSEIPGTGLGLFLSYGIIDRYGGDIKVKSNVGKGSKFTIRIPVSKNQLAPFLFESEEDKQATVPQNFNILLVDDEEPICTSIKKFFEAKGHSIATALSGKKGLKIFKEGSFDLVLADITMPDMDGVDLISKLKEIDQQVKFIVLTGHITEDKLESAKKAGVDHILIKPFRNEELYQVVGKVLSI